MLPRRPAGQSPGICRECATKSAGQVTLETTLRQSARWTITRRNVGMRPERPCNGGNPMKNLKKRRYFLAAACAGVALLAVGPRRAEDTVKIGFILPMTGQQQSTGKQIAAGGQTLHGAARRHGRRQESRAHHQGRRRRSRQYQAHRARPDRQRQGGFPRRLRHHAGGAGGRAARHRSQDARDRHRGRHFDHHREVALYRPHQLHAGAIVGADGRLGGAERHQESREHGVRLRARRRCREIVRRRVHRQGRPGSRQHHASRWPIRISRRSCSAPPTPSPTPSSCSCPPAKAASSSSNSSSAASTRPASRSSAPATSPTTTCSTAWATP